MAKKQKHFNTDPEIDGQCGLDTVTVVSLYTTWLNFLKAAGDYAARHYLLQDLVQDEHSPQSDVVLARYYSDDIRTLKLVLQNDIDRLEGYILAIRQYQRQLGLKSFKVDSDNLSLFIDFFSLRNYHAPRRREFYRRKIRRELKKSAPTPHSLDALEAAFKASKSYKAVHSP